MQNKARFITLEGGEGSGKSLQSGLLRDMLDARGVSTCLTREPGGASGAEEIRNLLVVGETGKWDPLSEMLLHFAARREHLVNTVWPTLEEGTWVISDRFADSTRVYQGIGQNLSDEKIETVYQLVAGDFVPDLTLILDIPVSVGLRRAGRAENAETRYERMGAAFHEKLREGYRRLTEECSERCVLIDAARSPEEIHEDIVSCLENRFPEIQKGGI